ncbi:MAG TPA: argininosuccinate lyase [Paracoccaceae bacterium]|nr:argininosuccinate lyase [Paracoccaceae bacterium]
MTRLIVTFFALATLAACGVDGAPKPPAPEPGVSISGQVQVGVVGGS